MSDHSNGIKKGGDDYVDSSHEAALGRFRSAASVAMTPELFEKLYLSPQNAVKGDLRKTFANPTPIAVAGFLLCLTPLSCDLMGWRGAGGNGAASIPVYYFQGGILMTLGALLEWILGNTFSAVVFGSFGTFWLSFAGTLSPSFAAFASYAPAGSRPPPVSRRLLLTPASVRFWLLVMALLCVVYMICAIRTNIIFFLIFLCLVISFGLLTGAYWVLAQDFAGNAARAQKLVVGGGAAGFACASLGWYLFLALLFAAVDFPIQLPVGDLSSLVRGHSERNKMA
ncbi:plasma membrane ammonium transporter (Ato3) [Cordyceps militaris]|uniref:Plasma membrane ammonium transporter (Ato3) n=1 Tax=Cordyceps militaris TaxID=73501 RepID=A0A2H4SIC9_CORMI|nr:plasma membrane ammonium transporter (Ato3) [Cordyceps militaris]